MMTGLISRIRMVHFKIFPYLCFIYLSSIGKSNADNTFNQPGMGLLKQLSDTEFQCSSGENITLILVCDGTKNCADGSDENVKACISKYPNACTSPENVASILITSCNDIVKTSEGDLFQEFTLASSPSEVNAGRGNLQLICINGTWISPIDGGNHISEKCKKLPTRSWPISLYYSDGNKVNVNNAHLTGTVIYPVCNSGNKPYPNVKEATCGENGNWSVDSLDCKACRAGLFCEYIARSLVEITSSGRTVICQAHYVSPYLIMTAASCFNESSSSEYYIYLDHYKNSRGSLDPSKLVKIVKIHYYTNSGEEKFNHPALAEVENRLPLNGDHNVVCLDWSGGMGKALKSGESGWGAPARHQDDPQLVSIHLIMKPCSRLSYFSTDHFSKNDSCVEFGDNKSEMKKGAGFYVYSDNSYYLRGMVIDTPMTPNYTVVFTSVWKYFSWIKSTIAATDLDYPNIIATVPQIVQMYEKYGVISFHDFELGCRNEDTGVEFDDGCDQPEDVNIDYEIDTSATKYKAFGGIAKTTKSNVPEFSTLRNFKCKDGYSSNSPNTRSSQCLLGEWLTPIPQCLR